MEHSKSGDLIRFGDATSTAPGFLVEPQFLAQVRDDPGLVVVDCSKPEAYDRAHITGAVPITNDYWLKEPEDETNPRGVHLMSPQSLGSLMSSLGVADTSLVVGYDDNMGRAAARLWWVLAYLGHPEVRILNGGWHGWIDGNYPISYKHPAIKPAKFTPHAGNGWIAKWEDVLDAANTGREQVVDVRSDEEWSGEDFHGNNRAGHILGAIHLEWSDLMCADSAPSRFRPIDQIRSIATEAGVDPKKPIITYCQGGIRASHLAFALKSAGYEQVRIYDGSMREWANNDNLPITASET